MATSLAINTHIDALGHFSATELLIAGINLRAVAGRLAYGGEGATTLRVYAACVAADRNPRLPAAETNEEEDSERVANMLTV